MRDSIPIGAAGHGCLKTDRTDDDSRESITVIEKRFQIFELQLAPRTSKSGRDFHESVSKRQLADCVFFLSFFLTWFPKNDAYKLQDILTSKAFLFSFQLASISVEEYERMKPVYDEMVRQSEAVNQLIGEFDEAEAAQVASQPTHKTFRPAKSNNVRGEFYSYTSLTRGSAPN